MLFEKLTKIFSYLSLFLLFSCGKAYFPIEFKSLSREERIAAQEELSVALVPMTENNIRKANTYPYLRQVVQANDLGGAAIILSEKDAIKETFPSENDPGPYRLGIGDELVFAQILTNNAGASSLVSRRVVVSDDGFINIYETYI